MLYLIYELVSVAEMQMLEQQTDATGHTYAAMMEVAGQAVADRIIESYGLRKPNTILILVGPGNNGGDGLVCARHLHQQGVSVRVYLWKRLTTPDDDYLNILF